MDYFKGTRYHGFKMLYAFKVENHINLKPFEKTAAQTSDSILKGLFISISKKQIPGLVVFGPEADGTVRKKGAANYKEKYCRIPESLGHKGKVEMFIKATSGFGKSVQVSSSCTL